jgi:PTH1 family peptidyl-tRNA hydrolase
MADPWLIAGLGNPGEKYARTRHNAGAMVVDLLCERLDVSLKKTRFVAATTAEARAGDVPLLVVRTTTYMNESGPPIASVARKRDIPVERVVIVHDEIDLPFGALRLKFGGSTAGHNGLESVVSAFRSRDFSRVRIGVGRPPGRQDPIGYVLSPFASREREDAAVLIENAADATLALVTDGLASAQDRYNRGGFGEA